jgi:hypothetical protein
LNRDEVDPHHHENFERLLGNEGGYAFLEEKLE